MTDYDRTVVRESATERPLASDRVVSREATYRSGPTSGEMIRRAVTILFGILQGLLVLRIILLLLGANLGNDIVNLILGLTNPFVEPFRTMFSFQTMEAGRSELDMAAIVALVGWTLVELLILAILSIGARRGEDKTV
jgi:hypothetical protein